MLQFIPEFIRAERVFLLRRKRIQESIYGRFMDESAVVHGKELVQVKRIFLRFTIDFHAL